MSSIDTIRDEGLQGRVVLRGRAHDILGTGEILSTGSIEAVIDYSGHKVLTALSTRPHREIDHLVGRRVSRGFRDAVVEALPDDVGSPLRALLDDLPVVTLVSIYALVAAGVRLNTPRQVYEAQADVCAGWARGGSMLTAAVSTGELPVATGAVVPPLDAQVWPNLDRLPPNAMRRVRRTDVCPGGDVLTVDSFFRDSHVGQDGRESAIHEYAVTATVDRGTLEVLTCIASPHVLPWADCPAAAFSASRVAGLPVADLRRRVREELTGVSTCTHLNDQLRSLADVETLAAKLAA